MFEYEGVRMMPDGTLLAPEDLRPRKSCGCSRRYGSKVIIGINSLAM